MCLIQRKNRTEDDFNEKGDFCHNHELVGFATVDGGLYWLLVILILLSSFLIKDVYAEYTIMTNLGESRKRSEEKCEVANAQKIIRVVLGKFCIQLCHHLLG